MRMTAAPLLLAAAVACTVPAFGKSAPRPFPVEAFRANEATAEWLVAYDRMAWESSDLVVKEPAEVLARLGAEWFCYEAPDGAWHAVYGALDAIGAYRVELHYARRAGAGVARTDEPVDPVMAARLARGVHRVVAEAPPELATRGLRLNAYARPRADGGVDAWLLPSGQKDGTLVFGGELHCELDAAGGLLSKDGTLNGLRAAKPDPSVVLDVSHEDADVPSVGDIFFLLTFGQSFSRVTLITRCYVSTLAAIEGHEAAWIHGERDRADCDPPARARVGRKSKRKG